MSKFTLKITQDGCNQVSVLEQLGFAEHRLLWFFNLEGDRSIILAEFYTDTRFLIVDEKGWVRAYDLSEQSFLLNIQLEVEYSCGAYLSRDKQFLDLCFDHVKGSQIYGRMCLDTFQQVRAEELPLPVTCQCFYERSDSEMLFYFCDNRSAERAQWQHGFLSYHPADRSFEVQLLPHAPKSDFFSQESFLPVFSQHDIAVMPSWSEIEFKEHTASNFEFYYKLQIICLDTLTCEHIPVRGFKFENLAFDDCSRKEIFQSLTSAVPSSEEYFVNQEKLLGKLQGFFFDQEGLWCSWDGGYLRRLNLSNMQLSKLLRPTTCERKGLHAFDADSSHFYATVAECSTSQLLLQEFDSYWLVDFGDISNTTSRLDDTVDINLRHVIPLVHEPPEFATQKRLLSNCHVELKDIDEEASLLDALSALANNVDIDAWRHGDKLSFIFSDLEGRILEEAEFFERVGRVQESAPLLEKLLQSFVAHPHASQFWIHDEAFSLAYATQALAKQGSHYFETLIKHLAIVDFDHDVVFSAQILPALLSHFSGQEEEYLLRLAFALIPSDGVVEFLREVAEDEGFSTWVNTVGADQLREWIARCRQLGLINEYLLEELEQIGELQKLYPVYRSVLIPV